jgi:hypothetical protein
VAWIIRTYIVVSQTPVVVEDPLYASSTVYQPGASFDARENNPSVVRLLEDEMIVEAASGEPLEGYLLIEGAAGAAGPTGPAGIGNLATVMGVGNFTGPSDLFITGGQKIMGGRACFGSSTSAVADGDLSAGAGANDLFWDASAGTLLVTSGSTTPLTVTGAVAGAIVSRVNNTSSDPAAEAHLQVLGDVGLASVFVRSSAGPTPNEIVYDGAGGPVVIGSSTTHPLSFRIGGTTRWSLNTSGHLTTFADDLYDIGIAGTNRPRTLFLSRSLDLGTTSGSTAFGDIKASDGANELFWDASEGLMTTPGLRVGTTTGITALGDIKASDGVNNLFWDASDGLLTVDNLLVSGTTTTINSEILTADNFILLNSEYVGDSPQTAGLVLNIDPSATSFGISDITADVITVTAGDPSAALSTADFILIQDPATAANAGLFEVLSVDSTTITIDTTPAEVFSTNTLTDDATTQGTVVGTRVAAIRSDTTGVFQTGTGTAAPLPWINVVTGVVEANQIIVDYDTSGLTIGDCARIVSANTAGLTDADSDVTADFIGVIRTVGTLGTGEVVTDGVIPIRFAGGLTLVATEPVFLSETTGTPLDGLATNVEPTTVGSVSYQIGYIKDASTYSGTEGQLAEVQLRFNGRVVIAV